MLEQDGLSSTISVLAWSPNGLYLAAGCVDGTVLVWERSNSSLSLVRVRPTEAAVTDIAWHPKKNQLLWVCFDGELHVHDDVIPLSGGKLVAPFETKVPRFRCPTPKHRVPDPS